MASPNFHTLPRIGWSATGHLQGPGIGDGSGDRRGCHSRRGRQIDLGLLAARAADEVTVVGSDIAFSGCEQPAVPSEAGSAAGRQHQRPAFNQDSRVSRPR